MSNFFNLLIGAAIMKTFALKEEDRNKLVSVLAEMQAKYSYNAIQLLHTLRELPQPQPQQTQPAKPEPIREL